jgi:hypothetical protein
MPWQYNQGRNDKYWWELKKKGGLHHSLKAGCSNKQIYAIEEPNNKARKKSPVLALSQSAENQCRP